MSKIVPKTLNIFENALSNQICVSKIIYQLFLRYPTKDQNKKIDIMLKYNINPFMK